MRNDFMNYEFAHPTFTQVTIKKKETHKKIGDIRIKPSAVLWKSGNKGSYLFYSVSMDEFIEWITTKTPASRSSR
jgi:hypothetical protein